jgi:hypothetical protein
MFLPKNTFHPAEGVYPPNHAEQTGQFTNHYN